MTPFIIRLPYMITYTHPVASSLPIKKKPWLLGDCNTHTHTHTPYFMRCMVECTPIETILLVHDPFHH